MNIRFEFVPLERWMARNLSERDLLGLACATVGSPRDVSDMSIAARCGVERTIVWRWRQRNWLSAEHVEQICDHMDVDPCEIWADYYRRLLEVDDGSPIELLDAKTRNAAAARRYRQRKMRGVPLRKRDRRSVGVQPPLFKCGTVERAQQHKREGLKLSEMDEACRQAYNADERARYHRKRSA